MRINTMAVASYKPNYKKGLKIVFLVILSLLIISIMSVSVYTCWNITHPTKIAVTKLNPDTTPYYRNVTFKDSNNTIELKGWYFEKKSCTKTVILSHGYGSNRLQFGDQTINLVKELLAKNYNVLLFDYRYSGSSEGDISTAGISEKDDLLGAVKYVKSQGSKQIFVLGFSMGAATAITAAAETQDINGVIADSSFTDLKKYLEVNLPVWSNLPSIPFNQTILLTAKYIFGLDTSKCSPISSITQIAPRPILFIHSKDDLSIPIQNSKTLMDAASKAPNSNVDFWETHGANHICSYAVYPKEYTNKVLSFLEKAQNHK